MSTPQSHIEKLEARLVAVEHVLSLAYAAMQDPEACICYLTATPDANCPYCDSFMVVRREIQRVLGSMYVTPVEQLEPQKLAGAFVQGAEAMRGQLLDLLSTSWDRGVLGVLSTAPTPVPTMSA